MLIYNPRHPRILEEFVAHNNEHRPQQHRGQCPPAREMCPPVVDLDTRRARRRTILHGIINEYAHAA
jgi:putative transposase